MNNSELSCSAKVRRNLNHPVIDSDGHMVEVLPVMFDYLKQVGGPDMADRAWKALQGGTVGSWYDMTPAQRRYHNALRPAFWAAPSANTRDRATAMLPKLMHERLPEMGIDYAVVYPTIGFLLPDLPDPDVRRAACRAHNLMMADIYRGLGDRLTPAAVIPCFTPEEAIEELDFAITALKLKVPMFANLVKRPIEAVTKHGEELGRYAFWVDTLALDSPYNYDSVWQKCMDLKVPVTAHAIGQGIGMRRSISNYMYNQTGHFADAGHAFAKALFFGGVTNRFPKLNFAFLEGGVAWGASLVCDLKERWEKRGSNTIQALNPERLDIDMLDDLFRRYGGEKLGTPLGKAARRARPESDIDDFAATGIETMEDFLQRLVPHFYYGCEADDRMNATAFDARLLPGGRKLNAVFSSDFGHWDVSDMSEVLEEAHELVKDGIISDEDFENFVYRNPVRLFAGMNPDFFAGTAIAGEVAKLNGAF
jgi:predicted TIM-barrel fold metal-dependent hydrolase